MLSTPFSKNDLARMLGVSPLTIIAWSKLPFDEQSKRLEEYRYAELTGDTNPRIDTSNLKGNWARYDRFINEGAGNTGRPAVLYVEIEGKTYSARDISMLLNITVGGARALMHSMTPEQLSARIKNGKVYNRRKRVVITVDGTEYSKTEILRLTHMGWATLTRLIKSGDFDRIAYRIQQYARPRFTSGEN